MDSRKKSCPNERCEDYKSKKYNSNVNFCPSCGTKLIFVCKSITCYKPIENIGPKHIYCEECLAKQKDAKDKVLKNVNKVVVPVVTTLVALVTKKATNFVKNIFDHK